MQLWGYEFATCSTAQGDWENFRQRVRQAKRTRWDVLMHSHRMQYPIHVFGWGFHVVLSILKSTKVYAKLVEEIPNISQPASGWMVLVNSLSISHGWVPTNFYSAKLVCLANVAKLHFRDLQNLRYIHLGRSSNVAMPIELRVSPFQAAEFEQAGRHGVTASMDDDWGGVVECVC